MVRLLVEETLHALPAATAVQSACSRRSKHLSRHPHPPAQRVRSPAPFRSFIPDAPDAAETLSRLADELDEAEQARESTAATFEHNDIPMAPLDEQAAELVDAVITDAKQAAEPIAAAVQSVTEVPTPVVAAEPMATPVAISEPEPKKQARGKSNRPGKKPRKR